MDSAIASIRADHEDIRSRFEAYLETADPRDQMSYLEGLFVAIEQHSQLEEEVFYPWVKEQGIGESWITLSQEEHRTVRSLLQDLLRMSPSNERFGASLLVLRQNFERHVASEEEQILPFAENAPGPALDELAQRMDGHVTQAHEAAVDRFRSIAAPAASMTAGHPGDAVIETPEDPTDTSRPRSAPADPVLAGDTTQSLSVAEQAVVNAVSDAFQGLHLETVVMSVHTLESDKEVSTLRFTLGGRASSDLHRDRIATSNESPDALAAVVIAELRRQLVHSVEREGDGSNVDEDVDAHPVASAPGPTAGPTMTSLPTDQKAHDPVCHMDIRIDDAAGRSTYNGLTYYFCSQDCQTRFEADPDAVLEAESREHTAAHAR